MIAALAAAAFIGYAVAGDVVPAPGGVYVEGIVGAPRYLNPLLAAPGSPDDDVTALVFNGLTRASPAGEVVGDLATDWSVDPSGKIYDFRLRRGVRWHDGRALGPEDVVATVRALQAADFPGDAGLAGLWRGVAVERTAEGVRFSLPEPNNWFPEQASLGVVPAGVAGLRGRALLENEANQRPIGTGPYRVVAAELRRIELAAWEGYHEVIPFVRAIELRFFGGEAAAMAALRRGELLAIRPSNLADAAATEAANAGLVVHQRAERAKTVRLMFNTRVAPLDDAATRAALASAIDRTRVASTQNAAMAIDGPRTAGAAAAREALERAGWRADADGARRREGAPLQLTIVTNDRPERIAAAEEVARQLGAVGARVEVQALGWSGMVADVLFRGGFDAALIETLEPSFVPDPSPLWSTGAAFNFGGWSSQRSDELLARARAASTASARAAALREWRTVFEAEAPAVALFHPSLKYVVSAELRGQQLPELTRPRDRFADVAEWFLLTRRAPGRF